MSPDNTINLNDILIQFNQDCECNLPDPDDCLLLIPVLETLTNGVPICPICGEEYSHDEIGIILQQVSG